MKRTKSNSKKTVTISWNIKVSKSNENGNINESNMVGNISMEVTEYGNFIRETVASALKGVAEGIDKNDDEE